MYTKCPECSTVFRVHADDLAKASGHVRCGNCASVFNALEALSEAPEATSAKIPAMLADHETGLVVDTDATDQHWVLAENLRSSSSAPEDDSDPEGDPTIDFDSTIASDEPFDLDGSEADTPADSDQGNSLDFESTIASDEPFDLDDDSAIDFDSASPDRIPSTVPEPESPPGDDADDSPLEFDAPEEEWSQVFTDTTIAEETSLEDAASEILETIGERTPGIVDTGTEWVLLKDTNLNNDPETDDTELESGDDGPASEILVEESLLDSEDAWQAMGIDKPAAPSSETDEQLGKVEQADEIATPASAGHGESLDETATPGTAVSETQISEVDALDLAMTTVVPAKVERHARWWSIGSVLLGLLLVTQLVHHARASLALQPVIGGPVQSFYQLFGLELVPDWQIDQYRLGSLRAIEAAAGAGTLLISASITNQAAHPQPYPLIRVILEDRWGDGVGSRLFVPAEYLDAHESGQLMSAGQRALAELEVVDPDRNADGFRLDVCLRFEQATLRCADQIKP